MADISRYNNAFKKKLSSTMAFALKEGTDKGQIEAATANHIVGYLPENAIVTGAYVFVKTASDAATSASAKLGTASGGTQIMSSANMKTAGKQGTFTGHLDTGSGTPVYLGVTYTGAATEVGEYVVVIDYLEYTKNSQELTIFS
tara:strand:+ start:1462 stop:1893 length:432 start_codon:yes stop_codon:yes gene_type:complete